MIAGVCVENNSRREVIARDSFMCIVKTYCDYGWQRVPKRLYTRDELWNEDIREFQLTVEEGK